MSLSFDDRRTMEFQSSVEATERQKVIFIPTYQKFEPNRFPESEPEHADGIRHLLVALVDGAHLGQQLQGQHPRLGEVGHDADGDREEAGGMVHQPQASLLGLGTQLETQQTLVFIRQRFLEHRLVKSRNILIVVVIAAVVIAIVLLLCCSGYIGLG